MQTLEKKKVYKDDENNSKYVAVLRLTQMHTFLL